MGVVNYLLVAKESESQIILGSADPSSKWDGIICRGLDNIKLISLCALLETGSADDQFEKRLDALRTISAGDQGPWVDIVPLEMLDSLASIAAMEEDEQESLARRLAETDELEGWDASDVRTLVRTVGDTAETAQLEDKTLLIWTSL